MNKITLLLCALGFASGSLLPEASAQAPAVEAPPKAPAAPAAKGALVSDLMLGEWSIDAVALRETIQKQMAADLAAQPGDDAGAAMAKMMMEEMIEGMSQMGLQFTNDAMVMSMPGEDKMEAVYEVVSSTEDECLISATLNGDTKQLRVARTEAGITINDIASPNEVMPFLPKVEGEADGDAEAAGAQKDKPKEQQ